MQGKQQTRVAILVATMFCFFLTTAFGQQGGTKKKEYIFHGKVEKIDAKAKTLTVNGENVEGWMASMSMTYAPDKDDVFKVLKVGDRITAKVYEGDYKVLYDIRVDPPAKAPAVPAKK